MFKFANPEYLYALYGIPVLIILFWLYRKNRLKLLERFSEKKMHLVLFPSFSGVKNTLKFSLIIISSVFLIIAAANPQIGTKMEEVKQTGIDVFILLDVSLSMQAEDIKPNRLEKAKFQITNLINRLRGDRIGLVIFSGEAYVQFPLTTDYSAANLFLSAVDFNSVPQPGTAIASAISLALKSFNKEDPTEKVIIIITDGEDHEGDINSVVTEANTAGVKIFTIGLGSTGGSPIPVYNAKGDQTGFKTDKQGNVVLTKLNEETLKQISSSAGGEYFRGSNYEDHLDRIYEDLSELDKAEFGVKKVTDYEDRFYYFLAPAIFLLLLEFFISEQKTRWLNFVMSRMRINSKRKTDN
ncbi:MAG: VWA domain-containing protein [Ignavibacteriales bacterium]|nr:MAG: VWA domain-containing protein [Ignavibacteriales bacterium]